MTIGKNDPSGTPSFPNVALWGLLCALLRFIPYIGPWVAAAFPLLVSLAVYKTVGVFIATGAMFVVVELLSNNFMEPTLYGSSTGMSTVAVLVSAVFWAWLWGPIGLLLATPMTVVLVVLGKYVPQLRFLDVLLGDEPVLDPPQRIYQRLLAMDSEEAAELLLEYREKMPLETVYDDILLPALALAEFDRARGMLDDRRQAFICSGMRDIIEEMGDRERLKIEALAKSEENAEKPARHNGRDRFSPRVVPSDCTVNVVCLPAHDEADEICNLMLAQLLNLRGYSASLISETSLASEMIEQIAAKHADVVVISALPPGAVAHARYLCKRVHARYPDVGMAVGLWRYGGDLNKAKARITCAATVAMATTLAEICGQIEQLAQRAMVREVPGAAKR